MTDKEVLLFMEDFGFLITAPSHGGQDPTRPRSCDGMLMSVHQHAPDSCLTCVGRMPCLIPVLCVPVPMTPAAATSETAPKLEADEGAG